MTHAPNSYPILFICNKQNTHRWIFAVLLLLLVLDCRTSTCNRVFSFPRGCLSAVNPQDRLSSLVQPPHLCGYNMLVRPYPFHMWHLSGSDALKAKIQMPTQHSAKYWFTVTRVTYVDTLSTTHHFGEIAAEDREHAPPLGRSAIIWRISTRPGPDVDPQRFLQHSTWCPWGTVACECVRLCVCEVVYRSECTSLSVDLRVCNKQ